MMRYGLVLCLAASCYAGSTGTTMRLRGGGPLGWGKLTKLPDVLKEGYGTETKLEVNTKSDLNEGTSIKSTFLRKAADTIAHTLVARTNCEGADIEATIDGSGKVSVEAIAKDLIPGGDITIKADLDGGQKLKDLSTPLLKGEYRRGDVVANVAVKGSVLDASAVVEAGDFQFGLSTSYNADSGKVADPALAARYQGSGFSATVVSNNLKGDDVSATYAQAVNDKIDVAGTVSTAGNKFSVAGGYKIDGDSSVRAKLDSDGQVHMGYSRQITKGASISAGLQVDGNDLEKRKFGVSLKLQ